MLQQQICGCLILNVFCLFVCVCFYLVMLYHNSIIRWNNRFVYVDVCRTSHINPSLQSYVHLPLLSSVFAYFFSFFDNPLYSDVHNNTNEEIWHCFHLIDSSVMSCWQLQHKISVILINLWLHKNKWRLHVKVMLSVDQDAKMHACFVNTATRLFRKFNVQ